MLLCSTVVLLRIFDQAMAVTALKHDAAVETMRYPSVDVDICPKQKVHSYEYLSKCYAIPLSTGLYTPERGQRTVP